MEDRKFRERNPGHVQGLPCVYVGMTGLSPEERFRNHCSGLKSNKYAHKFGMHLLSDLFHHLNPLPYKEAATTEKKLAEQLRANGFAVWQA